ncbi:MAG: hypothetical protein ABI120_10050 [Gemmatimonadaceae bacterium]
MKQAGKSAGRSGARAQLGALAVATLSLAGVAVAGVALTVVPASAQRIEMPVVKLGPNEGKRPTGWIVRADTNQQAGHFPDSVQLEHRGQGYFLTSGPPSLVWTPKNVARGNFIVASTLYSGAGGAAIPDGFGVFLGGKNMQTPNAQYTEFLIRNDGRYAVIQHIGPKIIKLRDWTQIAGINIHNGRRDYTVRNIFRVIVDASTVQLVVNRTMATSFPRAMFAPDGEFGMRIGTKQVIQIESLGLEKPPK